MIERLRPYRDIIVFVIALFGANLFWKYTVIGEESGGPVTWFGLNITAPFDFMAAWITDRAVWWLSLVNDNVYRMNDYVFGFVNDTLTLNDDVRISIVWGCTAIKQSFIWIVIMLTAKGDYNYKFHSWNKFWFIPLGLVCIYAFNIFRIVAIALLIEHHPDMFDFWHLYIFKYLFYGMIFLLWVWWEEKIKKNMPADDMPE